MPAAAYWSEQQLDALRRGYASLTKDELVAQIGRSWSSIKQQAIALGLRSQRWWTPAEDDAMRRLYPTAPKKDVLAALPGRSWRAIIVYASQMAPPVVRKFALSEPALVARKARNLHQGYSAYYWSEEDLAELRQCYASASKLDLLQRFQRSWKSIALQARLSGLQRQAVTYARWSSTEDDNIRRLFPETARALVLAALPGRTWQAIQMRAFNLNPRVTRVFVLGEEVRKASAERASLQNCRKIEQGAALFARRRLPFAGIKVRSWWEAAFIDILNQWNVKWQYEPRHFMIAHGCRYVPDFYLPEIDLYVEIKSTYTRRLSGFGKVLKAREVLGLRLVVIDESIMPELARRAQKLKTAHYKQEMFHGRSAA